MKKTRYWIWLFGLAAGAVLLVPTLSRSVAAKTGQHPVLRLAQVRKCKSGGGNCPIGGFCGCVDCLCKPCLGIQVRDPQGRRGRSALERVRELLGAQPPEKERHPAGTFSRGLQGLQPLTRGAAAEVAPSRYYLATYLLVQGALLAAPAGEHEDARKEAALFLSTAEDILDGQPEAAELRKVLEMIAKGTGTDIERMAAGLKVLDSLLERLQGDALWYADLGAPVGVARLAAIFEDGEMARGALRILQENSQSPPRSLPRSALRPLRDLTQYASKKKLSAADFRQMLAACDAVTKAILA